MKDLPAMWETQFRSLCWEDPLKKGMAKRLTLLILSSFAHPPSAQHRNVCRPEGHSRGNEIVKVSVLMETHALHSGGGGWKIILSPNRSFHVGIKCCGNNLQT